jgi:hypothetical protein
MWPCTGRNTLAAGMFRSISRRPSANVFPQSKTFRSPGGSLCGQFSSLHTITGHVSDLEGDYEFWTKYVKLSRVLCRDVDGKIELRPDCGFVFGGDSVDQGPGDLRVLSELVSLKTRYPDKVHLVLGNRFVNV